MEKGYLLLHSVLVVILKSIVLGTMRTIENDDNNSREYSLSSNVESDTEVRQPGSDLVWAEL